MDRRAALRASLGLGLGGAAVCAFLTLRRVLPRREKREGARPAVLCIGDSITFGAGVLKSRARDAWPRVLEELFEGQRQVLNYGISGATLLRGGDFPYLRRFWRAARAQRPETVLLMLGTNDSKAMNWDRAAFAEELRAALRDILSWPGLEKLVVLIPPHAFPQKPGQPVGFEIRNEVIERELRPELLKAAEELSLPVIDLYTLTESRPELFADGVHPNAHGNLVIAEEVLRRLRSPG